MAADIAALPLMGHGVAKAAKAGHRMLQAGHLPMRGLENVGVSLPPRELRAPPEPARGQLPRSLQPERPSPHQGLQDRLREAARNVEEMSSAATGSGRSKLAPPDLSGAIRGGGPHGLYNSDMLQELLRIAADDARHVSAPTDYEGMMRSLNTDIDNVFTHPELKRRVTTLSPYGKLWEEPPPTEFKLGGGVRRG